MTREKEIAKKLASVMTDAMAETMLKSIKNEDIPALEAVEEMAKNFQDKGFSRKDSVSMVRVAMKCLREQTQ